MHIDESFRTQIATLSVASFDLSADVTYIVDSDMRLRGYNDAWLTFAKTNGGAALLEAYPLGRSILDAMSPGPRSFYAAAYRSALHHRVRFDQCYECSSPLVFRSFQQSAYPLSGMYGLVVTNHIVEERPMDRTCRPPSPTYLTAEQVVVQCCHCRRVEDQRTPNKWDWVPLWVERSHPLTSHTFCPNCYDFYYGSSMSPALGPITGSRL